MDGLSAEQRRVAESRGWKKLTTDRRIALSSVGGDAWRMGTYRDGDRVRSRRNTAGLPADQPIDLTLREAGRGLAIAGTAVAVTGLATGGAGKVVGAIREAGARDAFGNVVSTIAKFPSMSRGLIIVGGVLLLSSVVVLTIDMCKRRRR